MKAKLAILIILALFVSSCTTASQWHEAGFTDEEAELWKNEGSFFLGTAKKWKEAGASPRDLAEARALHDRRYPINSINYVAFNNDEAIESYRREKVKKDEIKDKEEAREAKKAFEARMAFELERARTAGEATEPRDADKGTFVSLAENRMASPKKSPAPQIPTTPPSASPQSMEKKAKKESVVLMPLHPTKDIPQDEMTQYEAALVKSLSEKYVVYSGQRVVERVNTVYKQRSAETKAGKECDETKCLQNVALAFQTKEGVPFIGIANIRRTSGGYSISLKITDVIDDLAVFSEQKPCKGCDEFGVMESLKTIAAGSE